MKRCAATALALAASAILAAEDCRAETVVRGIEYDASGRTTSRRIASFVRSRPLTRAASVGLTGGEVK